ncbi:unnamed protein product [Linum tenue]|uniref:Coiled-coil domain-containing protein SCD2 n=1 Tax=Linum tenue TaxID=586396 RepID=A0AAV0HGE8_9ROSI|nr:unnamed protein product [Linum tenue]
MDSRYGRQRNSSSVTSPLASPIHPRHVRTGSAGVKKAQTKAAAQRLAQVMSHQRPDDDNEEDDDEPIFAGGGLGSIGLAGGRKVQPRSPMTRPVVQSRVPARAAAVAASEEGSDNEDDHAPISGSVSIGRAVGRSMRSQSPMRKPAAQSRVPVKPPQPVDEDSDKEDSSAPVIGRVSIGHAGARSVRPQSPMVIDLLPIMKAAGQIRMPVKTFQPQSDRDSDKDDDQSPVSEKISIGHGGGRSMQARPSMGRPVAQNRAPLKTAAPVDDDSDKDESYSPVSGRVSIGQAGGRSMRGQSPMAVRTRQDQLNSIKIGRPSVSSASGEYPSTSLHSATSAPATQINNAVEQQPLSARSPLAARSSINSTEQPPSARSTSGRAGPPGIRKMPSSVPISLRPVSSMVSPDPTSDNWKEQRLGMDGGSAKLSETNSNRPASALQDEIDMLQEENESLLDKLRLAEERQEEAEARVRQLEQQVANLGEGVSLEARLINRLVSAALRMAEVTNKAEEINTLRMEAESAKEEAAAAFEQLQEAALETKSLRNMTQRMVLTQEEMVCLSSYHLFCPSPSATCSWSVPLCQDSNVICSFFLGRGCSEEVLACSVLELMCQPCTFAGIHAEIAGARYGYWSSFAPLPVEVVLAAGQRAQAEDSFIGNDAEERVRVLQGTRELSGEGNIESMVLVERGLREMASLKVEDALALALAQQRRPSSLKAELSPEEADDVLFKQAWLTYFWRRAKDHGLEQELAEERLVFWTNHGGRSYSSQDAVDVERGLQELRKLGLENQLWHESRKGLDFGSSTRAHMETDF